MADQIPLDILVNIKDGIKSLNTLQTKAQQSFDGIAKTTEKSFKKQEEQARKSNDAIAKSFNTVKVAAAGVVAVLAGRAVVNALKDAVSAAAEEEQAIQRLNTALQINGNFTEEASKSFIKFADSIEKSSSFSAEAVLGAGALLENLTALDADGLQKATKSVVDLSAALGKDLNSTTQTLARAINGNVGALKRLGIEVDGSGTKAERLSKILDKLSKFNGAAAQQSLNYNGALTQLGIAFDDVLKSVGAIVVGNASIVASFKVITTVINQLTSAFSESTDPISDAISSIVKFGVSIIPKFITPLQVSVTIITSAVQAFNALLFIVVQFTRFVGSSFVGAINAIPNLFYTANIAILSFGKILFDVFETIGLFEKGAVTNGLNVALSETASKLTQASDALDTFDTLVGGSLKATAEGLKSTNVGLGKFNESFVGGLEKARPKINAAVDGFDNLVNTIKKGPKPLASIVGFLDDAEESTEDLKDANKDLLGSYNKLISQSDTLAAELEKQGKTKEEIAEIDFRNAKQLADIAREEIANNKKISESEKELARVKIDSAIAVQKAKRDAILNEGQAGAEGSGQAGGDGKKQAKEQSDIIGQVLKDAFNSGVELIRSGITQAFALGSAILDGQFFKELESALKSTILAPVEALEGLRSLADVFSSSLSGNSSLANTFKDLVTELPKFVSEFVRSFPALVETFVKGFPRFINELARAIPIIIDQIIKELPRIVETLADGFDVIFNKLVEQAPKIAQALVSVLPRIISSLLNGLTRLIEQAPQILQKILDGLPAVITALLSKLPQIIRALAAAIPQLIRVLAANLAPITIAIIEELPAIVQALFETMIPLVPDVMIALVDALITRGGLAKIVVALVKAAPQIGAAIIKGTIIGSIELGKNVGRAILDTLKSVEFPKIKLPALPKLDFSESTKNLLSGAKFSSNMKKVFDDFIKNLKNALKPSGITKGATSVLGQLGGAIGGAIGGGGGGGPLGLSKGGTVPTLYAAGGAFVSRGTDTVPAMLTPGELVVPRNDVARLSNFLDSVEAGNSGQSPLNLEKILSRIERSSQKEVTINIQVGEKQLSQVLLNLNRQGFRTA